MSLQMAQVNEAGTVVNVVVMPDDTQPTADLVPYSDANPAFIGGDYVGGYFYPPQPFPSWSRHEGNWVPPVSRPDEPGMWLWDEATLSWYAEDMS